MYYYIPVKNVTESRRNTSVHLFQSHRPGMGEVELQDERINKLIGERKLRQVWWKPETSWNVKRCIMCSEKRRVFRERISKKTVSCEEQIMSKDKHPSIFSRHIEAIVFIIPQIYYATHAVLKIGKCFRIFPSFSWEIFGHVTWLDQWRASENIWWIIERHMTSFSSNENVQFSYLSLEIILKWHIPPRFFPHYLVLVRNRSKSRHCSPSFT